MIKKVCNILLAIGLMLWIGLWQGKAYGNKQYPSSVSISRGARVWVNNCARCHNMRNPREFNPDQWQVIIAHMRVRAGLTGQETRDVLQFLTGIATSTRQGERSIRSIEKRSVDRAAVRKQSPNVTVHPGKVIYGQTCVACHGKNGRGVLPGVPDLTGKNGVLSKSSSLLLKRIEEGFQSPGSPMPMPPKGGNPNLTREQLRQVLDYMQGEFVK